jgi:toxin HigB-1
MADLGTPAGLLKYRDKRTKRFAEGERVKEFEGFKEQAERRLDILEAAVNRMDLTLLPAIASRH